MRITWLVLGACGGAPIAAPPPSTPAPPARPAQWLRSLDLDVMPAGPFRSAEDYCERWKARQNKGVAKEEERCRAAPQADGCISGYGPESTCWVEPLSTSSPFDRAQVLALMPPGGPADCYLALTSARETWLVYEVPQCAPGEGIHAALSTTSLATRGDALVWTYEHDFGQYGDSEHESTAVTCRRRARVPACDAESK